MPVLTIEQAIDFICERINLKDNSNYGVDIAIDNSRHLSGKLIELFSTNGEVLTEEAIFDTTVIYCWGSTEVLHKLWVDAH